ncbi:MAG: RES family NAD+ phosphorylase [Chloroflexi bacterium]|nr:RES family NAD+ phosphorylase [Chloroflexota bacterium]
MLSTFSGGVHRQTGLDMPALPPDRPAAVEARCHRAGDPWPLYASLEVETVWAEWSAATRGAVDPSTERRRLWRLHVAGLNVVDLRRSEARKQLDVDLDRITGPRGVAQDLAARARDLGADGLVLPSAAHPEHWNLVVFPPAFSKLRVLGSRATHPRPPA